MVYDSSLQVAEPATKQWRHWPGSLAKVPKDLKTVAAAPSPGYPAQTRTSCAGVELVTLIDSGATCGSLPEWLFAEIYERTAADVAKGKFTWSLHKNPSGLNVCLAAAVRRWISSRAETFSAHPCEGSSESPTCRGHPSDLEATAPDLYPLQA